MCIPSEHSSSVADQRIAKQLVGIWVNKIYLDTLESTKSPCRAVKSRGGHISAFWIAIDSSGITRTLISGMHDSANDHIQKFEEMEQKGNYRFVVSDRPSVLDVVEILSPDTVRWRYGSEEDGIDDIFIRITSDQNEPADKLERYINKRILAGTYRDQQGKIYTFTEEGQAQWPDTSFQYTIGIDCTFTDLDYIRITMEKRKLLFYSFTFEQGQLKIFRSHVNEDDWLEKDKQPLYVLRQE